MTSLDTVIADASDLQAPSERHREAGPFSRRRGQRSSLPTSLLLVALGIFLVAYGYARGREEIGFASPLYWTGQFLLFAVVVYRVMAPSTKQHERDVLVFVYAAAQSFIRWTYSPHMFTFIDELQHYRALRNVLDSGHLFNDNYSLPVSGHYPGLENIAAQLVQTASIHPFAAGVAVATLTHLLSTGCILLLFRELSRSNYVASIGTLIYLLNPHASFFNTSFLYEAPALPFAILAVLFAIRFATRTEHRPLNYWAVLVSTALVVMTHHVTALSTAALLGAVSIVAVILPWTRSLAPALAICAVSSALVVAVWIFGVAPVTIEYLGTPVRDLVQNIGAFLTGKAPLILPGPPTPLIDRLLGPFGVLVTLMLALNNLRRAKTLRPLEECWTWLALCLYGSASLIRVLVSNGSELAGRLLTYAAIFSALVVGTVLTRIVSTAFQGAPPGTSRFRQVITATGIRRLITATAPGRMAVATLIACVLLASSIMTSLPAWYQRVPGGFWIEGFAGGIDNVGVSRAQWADKYVRGGIRYTGDIASMWLLSTVAKMDPVKSPGTIYYSEPSNRFTAQEIDHIKQSAIIMVDVDMRMSQDMPIGERYFITDVNGGKLRKPIDVERLEKFDGIPGLSRVYDSGLARMYDLRGGRNAPYAR
ncbi:PMT family glycosyltransferase, 4-amino-4-deoxy-L-arabinose transferase (plasmid) [Mycobacterium sp. JS623]|uniref:PMT family glycosyltransferase 4-amino-4-deoxy-L-arabinose transferase n=1 Tax=Mycobacterium sp. JS623 TaxID=212767 RepID=UPI0002A5A0BB|nr:PMT family glycosyltransferase 4-amino-4-deoxy-L-arabinose transferase [Mycobacterium sp. JS623]AGB26972.1 PMT family glycosyltransferase, 4-amino-4-deoxy-L-arabinose transferase [Mycobacterium sp. JS623]